MDILLLVLILSALGVLVYYVTNTMEKKDELENPEIPEDEAEENPLNPVPLLPLEDIFQIRDASDFVIALNRYLCEKCEYDEKMELLSEPERIVYITSYLEAEVNNGGFAQFFYNSGGVFANELVRAFTRIGAVKTAGICEKAVAVYGECVPLSREERESFLLEHKELGEVLSACDDAFYAYEEDIPSFQYAYAMKYRNDFA